MSTIQMIDRGLTRKKYRDATTIDENGNTIVTKELVTVSRK
jgi:hypothetical protein